MRQAIQTQNLPIDVHIVPDGEQAMDFILRSEAEPDAPCPHLLLLDLNLPKRDGFEVLRWLRARQRFGAVPVLIITSSDSPHDQSRAAELGAGYFRKPPSYEEFLKVGALLKLLLEEHGLL